MNRNEYLKNQAAKYCIELCNHEVLKKYWDECSLIMKGSTARGFSDQYSDVDFVIFTDDCTKGKIIMGYNELNLSKRQDGILLPLGDWEGHYNIDTYDNLNLHFVRRDMEQMWEYINVGVFHDVNKRYIDIVNSDRIEEVFSDFESIIKEKYLELQINLDWLRQPLRRGDNRSVFLYSAKILTCLYQIPFLLNKQPYPCTKWLPYYFSLLDVDDQMKMYINRYSSICIEGCTKDIDLALEEYPLYNVASHIITDSLSTILKTHFGDQQWIEEWYLFT